MTAGTVSVRLTVSRRPRERKAQTCSIVLIEADGIFYTFVEDRFTELFPSKNICVAYKDK